MPHTDLQMLAEKKRVRDDAVDDVNKMIYELWMSGHYSSAQIGHVMGQTGDAIRMMAKRKGWRRDHHRDST